MNFYQAQDQARKQSRFLVVLFVLAVSVLVFITNICVALFVLYSNPEYTLNSQTNLGMASHNIVEWILQLANALGWKKCLWTSLLVFGVVFIAMGFKWLSLRQGGRVVAESVGGSLIQPSTNDALEKRLLNVVEEIALASGTPVPELYLLKNEMGINAFAAGLSPEDAVIGVTYGALISFNREQLQGVIAHEFSHILNGDMRLNMKLVAVLHGMLMIAESGHFFMKLSSSRSRYGHGFSFNVGSSHNRRDSGLGVLFFIFGLSLWLIGLLGQFLGALIKSAVSRQREFLADASAVQFTRNPNSISDALSIIGGASYQSKLMHHAVHELGHLFFSNANTLESGSSFFHPSRWKWFATHPPLAERIKRIQPKWSGRFIKPNINLEAHQPFASPDPAYPSFAEIQTKTDHQSVSTFTGESSITTASAKAEDSYQYVEFEARNAEAECQRLDVFGNNVDISGLQEKAINELSSVLHYSYDASLFIMSLLISDEDGIKLRQLKLIDEIYPQNSTLRIETILSLKDKLDVLSAKQRLSLIELALPSLKQMSLSQYQEEKALLLRIIQVDGKVDVFEWLIFQLVKQNLDRTFGLSRPLKPQYKSMQSLASIFEIVLSRVVHYGFEDKKPENIDIQDKRLAFIRACDVAGVAGLRLQDIENCDGKIFSQAVNKLGLAFPLLKPRLIKSLLAAVHFDEEITDNERYVITAIAAVMDCPLIGLDIEFEE